MKITKVTLQNFRGIGSLELDFPIDQNIIALVGINGVGKSSILDAIAMLLDAALFSKNITVERMYHQTFHEADYLHISEDSDIKISHRTMLYGLGFSDANNTYIINISKPFGKSDVIVDYEIHPEMLKKLLIYYSSDRQARWISSQPVYTKFDQSTIVMNENTSGFNSFFEWFKEIEDIENEERLERNTDYRNGSLEAVRKTVYSILGDGFSKLRVKRVDNDLIIRKNGVDVPINLLSDGEKSLIALVSDLAKKLSITYPNMENPLEGEGIVLIDEIELHMHPTWQRMIIPRLTKTFPNCQFIVTTHSPQVLSHVQPESIYLLKKIGKDIVVTKPQYSYGRDSNRILEDLMDETERPAEIQDQLGELFSLIHQGHLSEAQQLVNQLSETIGASEPELNKAEVMIKRREIIGR